ncbi:hypothetical protein O6H91_10G012000 [Diphasiastrum complanatum]|uniref:Uncharacterized protein n=1 Tax=Diphasiastrum complanatum TaxID=34168 RepID=A0ACC2CEI9_DIPCM|nr:hypothetical protein O6H91_10G012000 [Diphasiastrum complanatum]
MNSASSNGCKQQHNGQSTTSKVSRRSVSEPKQHCPDGWQEGPDKQNCFLFVNASNSWNNSETACQDRSGHLAALVSEQELQFVQGLCSNSSNGCWVGGHLIDSRKGPEWTWTDCHVTWNDSRFHLVSAPSTNCSSPICANQKDDQRCILVTNIQSSFVVENCTSGHAFVCLLSRGGRCQGIANHREYTIILSVVSCLISVTFLGIVIWLLAYRRSKRKRRSRRQAQNLSLVFPPTLKLFTVEEISLATLNFAPENRLGEPEEDLYKGELPDGMILVKKLHVPDFQGRKDFFSEMTKISRLQHANIVPLKGCCFENGEQLAVYNYLSNGLLDEWLHDAMKDSRSLDWKRRIHIAITIAEGIAFLHDTVKPNVVHKDIRASNVLLDQDFNAHLIGVGLAKFGSWEPTHERTVVAGTYGYLAPEFVYRNELTTKSDVYSFGVLLLELISGRKPVPDFESVDWQSIFEWATPLVQSQRFSEILDPKIGTVPDVNQVKKAIDLIYTCTQHVPSMRPRMSYVVHELQHLDVISVTFLSKDIPSSSGVSLEMTEMS